MATRPTPRMIGKAAFNIVRTTNRVQMMEIADNPDVDRVDIYVSHHYTRYHFDETIPPNNQRNQPPKKPKKCQHTVLALRGVEVKLTLCKANSMLLTVTGDAWLNEIDWFSFYNIRDAFKLLGIKYTIVQRSIGFIRSVYNALNKLKGIMEQRTNRPNVNEFHDIPDYQTAKEKWLRNNKDDIDNTNKLCASVKAQINPNYISAKIRKSMQHSKVERMQQRQARKTKPKKNKGKEKKGKENKDNLMNIAPTVTVEPDPVLEIVVKTAFIAARRPLDIDQVTDNVIKVISSASRESLQQMIETILQGDSYAYIPNNSSPKKKYILAENTKTYATKS